MKKIKLYIKTEDANLTWIPPLPTGLFKVMSPIVCRLINKSMHENKSNNENELVINKSNEISTDLSLMSSKELKRIINILEAEAPLTLVEIETPKDNIRIDIY